MSPKPLMLVVACALVDIDNRVLVTKRPPNKPMAGMWEFPGGKMEAGETPEQAIIRELEEELGIKTFPTCLAPLNFASHEYPNFHILMPLFICRKWEGILQARENQELNWVKPTELNFLEMPAADKPLVYSLIDIL
ncbi:MAG: 8-oxo-dGTP diphosphatase MutT [Rhizobiaceae bacterium]|nr:8-oxo-dGTP diphosphatase MutT [Rhizobiaceae bacterium]